MGGGAATVLAASSCLRSSQGSSFASCEPSVDSTNTSKALPKKGLPANRVSNPAQPLDVRLGLTKLEDVSFPLRWGIIGTGTISSDWCKCLAEVPGAILKAVAARDPSKAKDFAEKHGFQKSVKSYQDLVNDPEIDIVYIGTITPLHKEQTILALKAGKHVLCEKPLTENYEDAKELYDLAEKQGVMLLEGMWTRYFPAVDHARALVEKGVIGEVRMVTADFPELCYAVQWAPLFFGADEPLKVVSAGSDKAAGAVIQYKGSAAVLSFPTWAAESPEVVEIIGTEGRITLDWMGAHPVRITIRMTPALCWEEPQGHTSTTQNGVQPYVETYTYPLPEPWGLPAPNWSFVNQHGFIYQAQAVHRCLAAKLKECPQFPKKESLRIMKLLDEIEKGIENPCR